MPEKVNLNSASREELEQLKSIGPERAGRVIEYREEHGGFNSLDDLKNVQGFDDERVEEIRATGGTT